MAYDGLYGELSTRGAANEVLTLAIATKEQIEVIAAEVEVDRLAVEEDVIESATNATTAQTAATAAASSAVDASTYAGLANSSASLAQQWAENPEDSPVVPGEFSALHWAMKAFHYVDLDKAFRVPTVFDFGVVGDGVTDDTVAFQAAIDGTTAGLSLGNDPDRRFKLSSLVGRSDLKLVGAGILDFSANVSYATSVANPLFKFPGTAGSVRLLTSNALLGATLIDVDTTGIVAGDIVELATPGFNGGFIDSSIAVHRGETRKVAAIISSTQLRLATPVVDATGYTLAENAQLRKLNTLNNLYIGPDITIVGKGRPVTGVGDNGIVFFYGQNVKVHCRFDRVDLAAVRFEGCYNYEASGCRVYHDVQGTNSEINYGIIPSGSSSFGRIFGNYLENMRHGIVTSHLSSALGLNTWGVTHDIDIYNNTVVNTWHAGIATHNDTDRVRVFDNEFIGCAFGFNPRERNIVASRNYFRQCSQGILISGHLQSALFEGNIFEDCAGSAVTATWDGARDATDIIFRSNKGTRLGGGITLTLATPIVANARITFQDNEFTLITGAGGAQGAIRILGAAANNVYYLDNRITDSTGVAGLVVSAGGNDVLFMGNMVRGVSGNSYAIAGTFTKAYAKGNFGVNFSGSGALVNTATVAADNTLYAA